MEKFLVLALFVGIGSIWTAGCPAIVSTAGSSPASSGHIVSLSGMAVGRAAHTSTLLGNGTVLIAGGFRTGGGSLRDAELYTPTAGRFEKTGSMSIARSGHTATLLPDGKVLIAGGFDGSYLDSSEIFDPKTGRFSLGGPLTKPRSEHTATTLSDGRILLTGGVGTNWTFLSDAEIYVPGTGRFSPTGQMSTPRESHTATLLTNGKVLITGGHKDRRSAMTIYSSSETYDPQLGVFRPTARLTIKRHKHDAVLLKDGRVLISGGSDERDSQGAYSSIEIFDPVANRSVKVGETAATRYKLNGAVVRLPDGKVLIAGGSNNAELFDPATMTVTPVNGSFGSKLHFATATLLKNGRVLIAGGYDEMTRVRQSAWIYEPGS